MGNKNIFKNHPKPSETIWKIIGTIEWFLKILHNIFSPFILCILFALLEQQVLATIFLLYAFIKLSTNIFEAYNLREVYEQMKNAFKK